MLLDKGINSSTQTGIMRDFDEQYKDSQILESVGSFVELVLQINKNEPSAEFARAYLGSTVDFIERIKLEKKAFQL
jgi:sulfite reductase (ferredoxin)